MSNTRIYHIYNMYRGAISYKFGGFSPVKIVHIFMLYLWEISGIILCKHKYLRYADKGDTCRMEETG